MNVDTDFLPPKQLPRFLSEAQIIKDALQKLSFDELRLLYGASEAITKLNHERLQNMDLQQAMTPAIFSYEGIQFQYMGVQVFERDHFDHIDKHLHILSAMYGSLKPFDAVVPYRLEMQAKLAIEPYKDLYGFWGPKIANELMEEGGPILDLASKEYSKVVTASLPKGYPLVSCVFGEKINGKIVEKGTLCKMARGAMVRFIAENRITKIEDIRSFNDLGHTFSKEDSDDKKYVFIKK